MKRIPLSGPGWGLVPFAPRHRGWFGELAALPSLPATVPGDVQSDLLAADRLLDPYRDLQSREAEWVSQSDWLYWRDFTLPAATPSAFLHFEGVDHRCHVYLNGRCLGTHTGMFEPFAFDVSEQLRVGEVNRLAVVVERAPANEPQEGRTSQVREWKARFAYGWDFSPRLVPLGIWGEVWLELAGRARVRDPWVRTGGELLTLSVQVEGPAEEWFCLRTLVRDPAGQVVARAEELVQAGITGELAHSLPQARRWFPHGSGDQPLYRVDLQVWDQAREELLDEEGLRCGVRELRFVSHPDDPPGCLPYHLEVNGQPVQIKGWNWVPVDQLYGRPREDCYRHLLQLARHSGCNLLRVWGGGLLEREVFYRLCDELGLLVWQDFPQSSSVLDDEPAADEEYLAMIARQASAMVRGRRNHPSLALWCGGNELGRDGETRIADHATLVTLRRVVECHDPDRAFLPTTPFGPDAWVPERAPASVGQYHDVHGQWRYLGDPEHYRVYEAVRPVLHSEAGVDGLAHRSTLERALSPPHRWPLSPANEVAAHHGAWWLDQSPVERLFGPVDDLDRLIQASQWVQFEGLRWLVEAGLRRPESAGIMIWQLNEPWPNVSCTNAIEYGGQPKPAYWAVRQAYAPLTVSARYAALRHAAGATLPLELHTRGHLPPDTRLHWSLRQAETGTLLAAGHLPAHAAPHHLAPQLPPEPCLLVLELELAAATSCLARNQYLFSTHDVPPLRPLLAVPAGSPHLEEVDGALVISAGAEPLYFLSLRSFEATLLPAGYRPYLGPGERWETGCRTAVCFEAWNAPSIEWRPAGEA